VRTILPEKLITGRVRSGPYGSDDTFGLTGAFRLIGPTGATLVVMAADATNPVTVGWEHVSVSLPNRCPNWPEMCFVKDLFWGPDETVVQFHVPVADHINNHDHCLYLWRDTRHGHRLPRPGLVGVKETAP
jgi:hypothetical protein